MSELDGGMPEAQWLNHHVLPEQASLWCMTRHSVREQAGEAVAGYDVPLTPAGVILAEQWGARLSREIDHACTSPVGRCQDTLSAILRGRGTTLSAITSERLVEPGAFVEDVRHVWPEFVRSGPIGLAQRHLGGEMIPGMRSPQAGVRRILELFRQHVPGQGRVSLMVTHDTVLAAFLYSLMGRTWLQKDDWPAMMEAAWFWMDESRLYWLWRGVTGSRELEQLSPDSEEKPISS